MPAVPRRGKGLLLDKRGRAVTAEGPQGPQGLALPPNGTLSGKRDGERMAVLGWPWGCGTQTWNYTHCATCIRIGLWFSALQASHALIGPLDSVPHTLATF